MIYNYDRKIRVYDFDEEHDAIEWEDIVSNEKSMEDDYCIGSYSIIVPKKDTKDVKLQLQEEFNLIKEHLKYNPSTYIVPDVNEQ